MSNDTHISQAGLENFDVLKPNAIKVARLSALAAVLLLCFLALASLALEVYTKLEDLRGVSTDNAEWNFSQVEVDYFRMRSEIGAASATDRTSVQAAIQAFDIFYSRISIVTGGPYISHLLNDPQTATSLGAIQTFLDNWATRIDAGRVGSADEISNFAQDISAIQPDVRRISVYGLQAIVTSADHRRQEIANTLLRLAIFTTVTIVVLLVSSLFLFRFNQLSERSEAKTRMINKRLSTVLNASLDAILVMDYDGNIVEFNTAAEVIFGYSLDEVIGQPLAEMIVPEKYRKAHNAGMDRFRETGKMRVTGSGRIKLSAINKNKHEFPIELTLDMLQEGGETLFVAFIRDITLEVVSQEELVAARDRALAGERAKADFLSVMSHEMRTPLNGIIGTLALLEDTELTPKQRESIAAMRASATLMQHHVNDVLDISRFEAGKSIVNEEIVDIDQLVSEIVAEIADQAHTNRNSVSYSWSHERCDAVITDRHKLRQVLNNLVDNANKFTRDGQILVEIEASEPTSEQIVLEFRVFDTGIGIHSDDLDRIFNDFETIDSAYTRAVEGVGLGLGIVRRLVQALGGQIGVESTENTGSMFWVRLPVRKSELNWNAAPKETRNAPIQLQPMKILMVEDNQINRYVLREMLTTSGHYVDEAENGQLGVEAAEAKRYDVILMDISMPVKDGVVASTEIREGTGRSANTPIIATTAHALPHEIEKFRAAGISDILKKPIEKAQLFGKLATIQAHQINPKQRQEHAMGQTDVDIDRIQEMTDQLGQTAMKALIGRFSTEADTIVDKMNDPASKSADVLELVAEMHKVAGSAAALGVAGMQKQLNIMEHCGKTGDLDRLWIEAEDLQTLWGNCKAKLTELELL